MLIRLFPNFVAFFHFFRFTQKGFPWWAFAVAGVIHSFSYYRTGIGGWLTADAVILLAGFAWCYYKEFLPLQNPEWIAKGVVVISHQRLDQTDISV